MRSDGLNGFLAGTGAEERRSSAPFRPRSAPAAGRAFTTEACRWNAAVLRAEELVLTGLAPVSPGPRLGGAAAAHGRARRMSATRRASRRLVAAWLAAVLVGDLDSGAPLLDAEHWFTGAATAATRLPLDCARHAQVVLEALAGWDGALDMLPYALDPIRHEYRRDVLQDEGAGEARVARKERGSFFTPTDVADHITEMAMADVDVHAPGFRVLDPAAGTGVFLRSAFHALLRRGVTPASGIAALHGIDLDECCVDMAAFVLLVDFLRATPGRPPGPAFGMWSEIRSRLLAADTLLVVNGVGGATTLFDTGGVVAPEWLGEPFDIIVGNPPYARLGRRPDLGDLAARYRSLEGATAATDVYPAFLELLCSRLRARGAGSMVVPMSIGYSNTQSLRRLRQTAVAVGGEWTFEFFDRTPDALFGDDVKQRTAVVTRRASDSAIAVTGPVMRWTSRNRAELFARLPRVELGRFNFGSGVPKLGSADQADVYVALRARPGSLGREVVRRRRVIPPVADDDEMTVYVAGTAYNWLGVYRQGAAIASEVQSPTTSPLLALTFPSAAQADASFALLSSRLTFWLWRVESDAFHVPCGWVTGLPLAPGAFPVEAASRLAAHGRSLWAAVVQHPVVSVNGGRTTFSYCPHAQPELLDAIDGEVLGALGLPSSFRAELSAFVRDLTTAGRDSVSEHGLRRALASWRAGGCARTV